MLPRTKHAKMCKMHEAIPLLMYQQTHLADTLRKVTWTKCIDTATEFAKAPNFFGMGQRSRSSLLSKVKEARQKRGIPRPVKTNVVCLKDFLEALLVTCVTFQHALSSVYCSISFTRDLQSAFCQRLRAAFTRHLHPHPCKTFLEQ